MHGARFLVGTLFFFLFFLYIYIYLTLKNEEVQNAIPISFFLFFSPRQRT